MSGPGDKSTYDANGVMAAVYDPTLRALRISGSGSSGAPANASYVTMASESGLSNESVLGTAVIMAGILGSRPAAATAGRLYAATDNGIIYRDTGSTWVAIGGTSTGVVVLAPATSADNVIQASADATELTLKAFAGQTAPSFLIDTDAAQTDVVQAFWPGGAELESLAMANADTGYWKLYSTSGQSRVEIGAADGGGFPETSLELITGGVHFIRMHGYVDTNPPDSQTLLRLEAQAGQVLPVFQIVDSGFIPMVTVQPNGQVISNAHVAPADGDLNNSDFALWLKDTVAANAINFKAKDSAGTVVTRPYAIQPIDSHTATVAFGSLAVGTPKQNALGYDILVMGTVDITAATGGSLKLGTGPTSTPTTDPITASITTAALSVVGFSAVVPNGYYISLASAGTITLTSPVVVAVPV